MNRTEKQQWIDATNASVKDAAIVLVAHYKGLTVAEITQLRVNIRAAGAGFKVTKNLLAKRAIGGTTYEKISHLFKGPTAIAYAATRWWRFRRNRVGQGGNQSACNLAVAR